MATNEQISVDGTPVAHDKRQYRAPELRVFGKVALLTKSSSGACQGDSGTCTPKKAGTTGPKK